MMLDEENVPPPATRLVNGPSRPDPSPSCATELFRGGGLASSNSGLMLGTMARDGACAAAMRLAVSSSIFIAYCSKFGSSLSRVVERSVALR